MILKNFYFKFPYKNSFPIIFFGVHRGNKYIAERFGKLNYVECDLDKINIFFILRYIFSIKTIFLLINNSFIVFYFYCHVKYYNPKIVVTFYDNDLRFYCLKKYFQFTYFVSIQNGSRGFFYSFFGTPNLRKISKKKKLSCDFLFVHNNAIKDEYAKYIHTKIISCGSFYNNKFIKRATIKSGIGYISQWRYSMKDNNYIFHHGKKTIRFFEYLNDEAIILPLLFRISREKGTQLKIIGCSDNNSEDEKNYYLKKYPSINFKFIPKNLTKLYQNYNEIDKCSLVVSIRSTLGYESLSRLNKTVILMNKNHKLRKFIPVDCYLFGWPKKFALKGLCHFNRFNNEELYIFLNKIYDMDYNFWRLIAMPIAKKLMNYDKNNKIIFEILSNILRGKIA